MSEDVENVQVEVVSEGTTPKTEETVKVEPAKVSPEDAIAQKISEATKSFAEQVEASKRELQSVKDKHKAELERAQREAQIHKETFNTFKSNLGELDPEMSKNLELAELRSKDKASQVATQNEQIAKQRQEAFDRFNSNITQFITESGIDPNDKRVDWGSDAQTLLDKQNRILASVAKIHKVNAKDSEEKQSKTLKDEIAKVRKELGLDSVDTSNPVGVNLSSSKAELNKRYANGEISTREYEEGLKKF